jgi:hypothetical protein
LPKVRLNVTLSAVDTRKVRKYCSTSIIDTDEPMLTRIVRNAARNRVNVTSCTLETRRVREYRSTSIIDTSEPMLTRIVRCWNLVRASVTSELQTTLMIFDSCNLFDNVTDCGGGGVVSVLVTRRSNVPKTFCAGGGIMIDGLFFFTSKEPEIFCAGGGVMIDTLSRLLSVEPETFCEEVTEHVLLKTVISVMAAPPIQRPPLDQFHPPTQPARLRTVLPVAH